MANFTFDYVFLPAARQVYLALDAGDQRAVDSQIALSCRDPAVDNHQKFVLYHEPYTVLLFDDRQWSIFYRIVDQSVIELRAIDRAQAH